MASSFLGTYNPKEVTISLSGIAISGFADGTFITIARADNEIYKMHVGAYGESARTKNNNETGTITFTLKATSPSNKILDGLKNNPATFPALVKNNSTSSFICTSAEAWVNTDPDIEFAAEESMVEWVVMCADLLKSHL
jgi:hypothetical protein